MRKLESIFIGGALLLFLLGTSYGEGKYTFKYFPKDWTALHQKLMDDLQWIEDKQIEQIRIIANTAKTGKYDIKVLDRAKELASEVFDRIDLYEYDLALMPLFFGHDQQMQVISMKAEIAKASASMFMEAAEGYMKAGSLDEAKKLCRMVITTYTGNAYKSYVKKAEFMLEDIKELEKKKELEQKKEPSKKKGKKSQVKEKEL